MTDPATPQPGDTEAEFGIPIPGVILPPEQWAKTALKKLPPQGPLNLEEIFGRSAPLIVELGCGNGRYTLMSALARPECNHLASDILPAVIRYATRRANQRGLHHVRFAVKDAQTLVREYLPPGSAAEIHIYHPQPFHDRREAYKRLITPPFLADVHRALQPGGLIFAQTDSPEYWGYMLQVCSGFFHFQPQNGPWPDAPEGRSRREILSRSRGVTIYRGFGSRRDDLKPENLARLAKTLPKPLFRTRGVWCELDELEQER